MAILDELVGLVPPPGNPSEPPNPGGWAAVEDRLGFELPQDYKEYVGRYGTGALDNFLWVLNPFSRNVNLNLIDQAAPRLAAQREFSAETGVPAPYPLHPEANGLFPWAVSDNGDVLYWLCSGPPAGWRIVACDSRASQWSEFDLSTVPFLLAVLARRLVVDVFPEDFPSELPEFAPLQ